MNLVFRCILLRDGKDLTKKFDILTKIEFCRFQLVSRDLFTCLSKIKQKVI